MSDNLIIDYINRFWLMDVDARIQLFDLKTTYQFQTQPGVDRYNIPLYDIQTEPGSQNIAFYPVYQGFTGPVRINGIEVPFYTDKSQFYRLFPNIVQNLPQIEQGDGVSTNYDLQIPLLGVNSTPLNPPIQALLRGHIDITGIIATGLNVDPPRSSTLEAIPHASVSPAVTFSYVNSEGESIIITDSGQMLFGDNQYGLLMQPGTNPFGDASIGPYSTTQNTINYLTGAANVTFPSPVPSGANISAQVYYFQAGLPRAALFFNNTITLRTVPDRSYQVEMEGYLSPAAFLASSDYVPFAYMSEYIARGAARKILSDTGDVEQFSFYEPLFREQEMLVWKRSQRQFTATRTPSIYGMGLGNGGYGGTYYGGAGQ